VEKALKETTMSPSEIDLICSRLDRIESKLDENIRCQSYKVPRVECGASKEKLWHAIDGLKRLVWIGLGVAIAASVFIPLILAG
jgi:hypothetical protein